MKKKKSILGNYDVCIIDYNRIIKCYREQKDYFSLTHTHFVWLDLFWNGKVILLLQAKAVLPLKRLLDGSFFYRLLNSQIVTGDSIVSFPVLFTRMNK